MDVKLDFLPRCENLLCATEARGARAVLRVAAGGPRAEGEASVRGTPTRGTHTVCPPRSSARAGGGSAGAPVSHRTKNLTKKIKSFHIYCTVALSTLDALSTEARV